MVGALDTNGWMMGRVPLHEWDDRCSPYLAFRMPGLLRMGFPKCLGLVVMDGT